MILDKMIISKLSSDSFGEEKASGGGAICPPIIFDSLKGKQNFQFLIKKASSEVYADTFSTQALYVPEHNFKPLAVGSEGCIRPENIVCNL
jgi:hypothetical protein